MALRNLISKITGAPVQDTAQQTELRQLLSTADSARRVRDYDLALETYQKGLAQAEDSGYLQGQEVFLSQIGSLQTERRQFEEGQATLEKALDMANRTGEDLRRARALLNLGAHYLARGDWTQSQKYLEQSLELARPVGDPSTIALALGNLADVYLKQNNPSYAIRLLKEAVVLVQVAQNSQQAAYIIGLMGQAHLAINDVERARKFLTQAVQLARQYNQPDQELLWSNLLADQLYKSGQLDQALQLYSRCEELAPNVTTVPAGFALRNLINQGVAYQKASNSEKALDLTMKALEQSRTEGNAEVEALALMTLGSIHQDFKHPDEAIAALEGAIELYSGRAKNDAERLNAMIALGKLYEDRGQPDKAAEIFQKTIDEAGENRIGRAMALRRLGTVLQTRGNLQGALEKWTEALTLFEQSNEVAQAARLLCDIGAARRALSGINSALPDYERATMMLSNVHDAGTRGAVLSNVANLYTDLGEVETAQSFYQESIQLARQTGQLRAESLRMGNFAWFHLMVGHPQESIRLLEQAIAISRQMNDQLLVAVQTSNLGQAYHELKDYATAHGLYEQAISAAESSPQITEPRWGAMFRSNLGRTLLAEGNVDEAISTLEQALAVSRAANDQESTARTLVRLADAYYHKERYDDAENTAREGENIARRWGYRKGQADALMIRSTVARAKNDPEGADRFMREAYKLYTILHDPLATDLARALEK